MLKEQIDPRLIELQDLPTLPEVMARILEAANDPLTSAEDLAALLEKDHAISARVLRMANSAFFARLTEADSVHRAVVVIGFEAVKDLALGTSVFATFSARNQCALDPRDFWMHSLGTATAAKFLVEERMPRSVAACFTAGMLHDIGKYVMALQLGEDYGEVLEEAHRCSLPLPEVELQLLGITHSTVGKWVAEKWHFPQMLTDIIAHFYDSESYGGEYGQQLAAVALADSLSQQVGLGRAGDCVEPTLPISLLTSLGIELSSLDGLRERLEESVEEIADFFRILKA